MPNWISRDVWHVSIKHGPQFRVDITYPVDPLAYHLHLPLLCRIYFIECPVEESAKFLAVVQQQVIVYHHLAESVISDLRIIR